MNRQTAGRGGSRRTEPRMPLALPPCIASPPRLSLWPEPDPLAPPVFRLLQPITR